SEAFDYQTFLREQTQSDVQLQADEAFLQERLEAEQHYASAVQMAHAQYQAALLGLPSAERMHAPDLQFDWPEPPPRAGAIVPDDADQPLPPLPPSTQGTVFVANLDPAYHQAVLQAELD